ncbi:hypothetical protein ACFL6N_02145 [Thermodesulfobacteriota bacterium]
MSEEAEFIPYEMALKVVGNVIEEEHIQENDRRILTVYDKNGRELCWYDAAEVLSKVEGKNLEAKKTAAVEWIMHRIPVWAVDDLLKSIEDGKQSSS